MFMKPIFLSICSVLLINYCFAQIVDTQYSYSWQNNEWQVVARTSYSYNSNCKRTKGLYQYLENNTWINSSLTSINYSANGNDSEYLSQDWDAANNTWENSYRFTSKYNNLNQLDSSLNDIWWDSQWLETSRQIYTYNNKGKVDSFLYQTLFSQWTNNGLTTYIYNSVDSLQEELFFGWSFSQLKWDSSSRRIYTYDIFNRVYTVLYQLYYKNNWENYYLYTNSYNNSNEITSILFQSWNNTTSNWENSVLTNYTYNSDATLSEEISQEWDKTTSAWLNSGKVDYHYTNCILPIVLFDFSAACVEKDVQLKWISSSEINSRDFGIERSIDGKNFINIGTVNTTNSNTQRATYEFIDVNATQAGNTKLYYRLRLNDKNGKYTYSKIVAVNIPLENTIAVYPNPVKDIMIVVFNSPFIQCSLHIIDQNGKTVYKQQIGNMQQKETYKVNTTMLAKGIYYLQIISDTGIHLEKFIKN